MIWLLIFYLLIVLFMSKMETEAKAIYGKEIYRLLVDNDFLLSSNPNKSNDHAHHVQHHISMTW